MVCAAEEESGTAVITIYRNQSRKKVEITNIEVH